MYAVSVEEHNNSHCMLPPVTWIVAAALGRALHRRNLCADGDCVAAVAASRARQRSSRRLPPSARQQQPPRRIRQPCLHAQAVFLPLFLLRPVSLSSQAYSV